MEIQQGGDDDWKKLIHALSNVVDIQDDPIRDLKFIAGSARHARRLEQYEEYNVAMVNAEKVWKTYHARGENIRVCVMDSGLKLPHEDLIPENMFGSNEGGLWQWDKDTDGHGCGG
jgi:hypothetical protein